MRRGRADVLARVRTRWAPLVVVVAAVLVAMACTSSTRIPIPNSALPTTAPAFGVASIATLTDRTIDGLRAEARAIRDTGATWIRIVVNWNETEPHDGVFYWQRIDDAVAAAREQQLSILGLIGGPAPNWAGTAADSRGSVPRDPVDIGRFSGALAARFAHEVAAWEVWNEPNLRGYWTNPSPKAYVPVLRAVHDAIKAADPPATIVLGGLSPDVSGIPVGEYLEGVYAAGGGDAFDAVGLHPYVVPSPLGWDPFGRLGIVHEARAVMARHGQSSKQIWITEWGQSTGTAYYAVTEERQASIIVDGLRRLRTERGMGPVFLFTTKDWSTDPAIADLNYGLYRYDYSPKPVVARLRAVAR